VTDADNTTAAFRKALKKLPSALQAEVTKHWQCFVEDAAKNNDSLPTDETTLAQLVRVWACSDFVARSCTDHPHLLRALLVNDDLTGSLSATQYTERLAAQLEGVNEETALASALRQFRRWAMVRIAWRDLTGLASSQETLLELSTLADTVTDQALQRLYAWHTERFGAPRDSHGQPQRLVVLGMGKLGGQELNYSSDIDVIFAFREPGDTDAKRTVSNEEFFRRLAQRFIKMLNEITADGFVFRVDTRLRPFGASGPLVMHFDSMEHYYQTHGRDWERYALIKARVIAGDRPAGDELLARLRPFIYRRYLDYGALEALRTMKNLIAKQGQRKGLQHNIKLGPGGIREIEFIGQVFQLIYGGREPTLRERNCLRVLDYLGQSRHLPQSTVASLKAAYDFLRRTENCLQAWADQQTHQLPNDTLGQIRLAYAMGWSDWDLFYATLNQHLRVVAAQFEQIFVTPPATDEAAVVDWTTLWCATIDQEAALHLLIEHGFDDAETAWRCLQNLRNSLTYRTLSQRGRERMDNLIPLLLSAVKDTAKTPATTLERILRLLEVIAQRSVYLALLIENSSALTQLVSLCDTSPWISRYLARYPLLLDELLDPASLYRPLDRDQIHEKLGHQLTQVPADDPEQLLDALRHFKHSHVLRVAAADVSATMPLMIISDYLTVLAEALLRRVLELAWNDLTPRFGQPCYYMDGERREAQFVIIAYGKLGGIELNYSSDLDLVFLHDSSGAHQQTHGPREIENPSFFAKLVRRIIYWLTTQTAAGELYPVDMRLRPSGRSGLLVSSLDAFVEYQRNQAWTWEHQALVRARPVAGSAKLGEQFIKVRQEILSRPRDPQLLRNQVREMRQRMRENLGSSKPGYFHLKQDSGGIADIEFMVQYAVLAYAHRYPVLLTYTDNIRQLDGLEQMGILSSEDATLLRDAYRGLRRQLHRLTLQERGDLIPQNAVPDYQQGVVEIWQRLMETGD
jgi:glutamate-ammonia-ligase adenylyltransferase